MAFCLWLFFLIAVIDGKTQGIPDALNLPLVALTGFFSWYTGWLDPFSVAIGVGFLGMQWLISRGDWVGSGDLILIASMGFLMAPWPKMIACIFLAYILGSFIAGTLLLTGIKKRTDALAFAPFLVLSTFIMLTYGDVVMRIYGY